MTFNSSQQERLLAALERIADALERQPADLHARHVADTDTDLNPRGPYA